MASLHIRYTGGRKATVAIEQPNIIIGRDASTDLPLDDALISRQHAKFYRDEQGRYWIQDLDSKNGITVNEKPVTRAPLRDGDVIGIGTCWVTLKTESAPGVVLSDADADTHYTTSSAWHAADRFDLPQRRLEKLYELNERLTGRLDRDDLLNEVLDICIELLRFERAGVAVWHGEPLPLEWVQLRNLHADAQGEFRISRSLVDRAIHNTERILAINTGDDKIDPTASMISHHICSAMCVPMEYHQQVRGVIYGDRTTSTGGYTKEDIDFFAALGRLAAMGLANIRLVEEMRRRQEVELQLQWARQTQNHLLPAEPLTAPGLTIDALNDPGQKVSGDYFDYFKRADGLITLVIADVSGKGVAASLLMANLQAAVHLMLATDTDLPQLVKRLNALVCSNAAESRFITGIIGLLDPATRTFRYVNAGHLGPYLLGSGDRLEKVQPETCLPLGIEPAYEYTGGAIKLGDAPITLFLYTDGVPDAENEQGEQFQENRLAESLRSNLTQPPRELVTRVRRSIKQFTRRHPQTDDITMVAVRLE